ncbi:hypothetical protein GUJ93_ZPchr0007g6182 [Zizania palustris]|uniref:Uncharacterized protein n=1 Tax=Zizania palustris TaxID=103762 RepID=A0A8J5W5G9_ZIZPA|nr:hypothetical protein GUJ93_ZPchr0007g6182 [Zizania palustris]
MVPLWRINPNDLQTHARPVSSLFPLDEDELPPNGGNPHPFNGDVFPGELEWVQQWVDEQMIQGAFPAEADPEVEPQVVNIIELVVEEGAWDDWPAQLPPAPQAAPPQQAVNVQISGASNQPNSISTAVSEADNTDAVHSLSGPQDNLLKPHISIVYKRRKRIAAPATMDLPRQSSKGKELLLPDHPSVQDFAQESAAGMVHAPLSIGQIQHSTTHYCGLLAAQLGHVFQLLSLAAAYALKLGFGENHRPDVTPWDDTLAGTF